jgi:hypothetical protein
MRTRSLNGFETVRSTSVSRSMVPAEAKAIHDEVNSLIGAIGHDRW